MSRRLIYVALCVFLSACSGAPKPIGTAGGSVVVVASDQMPPPTAQDQITLDRTYLVGPFDKLKIDVFGVPDLSQREVQVDAGGRLSFPLVGTITVAGLSPEQVAQLIRSRLQGVFIRDPQVTVNLQETVSQVITVDGEVREPGLYPVIGRMTLMRAVATAKGLAEFARQEDVVVFRTVAGQKMAALYNLKAIRRGTYGDPEVYANDLVVVGDSPRRRLFKDLIGASALAAPLFYLLR